MRAARWMNVPPWDMEDIPVHWRERALAAESIESEVAAEQQRKQAKGMSKGAGKKH